MAHAPRRRLDAELVRRGMVPSREQARVAIDAGRVTVGGAPADKPARLVGAAEPIHLEGEPPRFVSRAGQKLDAALGRFRIDVQGARVLDAGASTGGFTDCLLQRGAREVVAVDVGYGQLHERLRRDPRVRNLERTNVRSLDPAVVGEPVDLVTADLSFISLAAVFDALLAVLRPGGRLVVLVKPQFEAGRAEADRGRGVISDPAVWRRVLEEVIAVLADRGAIIMGCMVSPVRGGEGNVEFVLAASTPTGSAGADGSRDAVDLDPVIAAATALGSV